MLGRASAAFLLALEFLTIVRLRRHASVEARAIGASVSWFPLVGLLLGAMLVAVDWLARAAFPVAVATALVLLAGVVLTGALHLDGLADTADGLFGGHTPEQRLEIMKDSRTGSFGVVAVVLALLLQYAALVGLDGRPRGATLLATPVLARFGVVLALTVFPSARPSGLGHIYRQNATPNPLVLATGAVLLVIAVPGVVLLVWTAVAAVLTLMGGAFASRRLGGLTGDIYGALVVLVESAVLLAAAGLAERPWAMRWLLP